MKLINIHGNELEYVTILEYLEDMRIFSVGKSGDGFLFVEGCDSWFAVTLTKEQMIMLAKEILGLALKEGV